MFRAMPVPLEAQPFTRVDHNPFDLVVEFVFEHPIIAPRSVVLAMPLCPDLVINVQVIFHDPVGAASFRFEIMADGGDIVEFGLAHDIVDGKVVGPAVVFLVNGKHLRRESLIDGSEHGGRSHLHISQGQAVQVVVNEVEFVASFEKSRDEQAFPDLRPHRRASVCSSRTVLLSRLQPFGILHGKRSDDQPPLLQT